MRLGPALALWLLAIPSTLGALEPPGAALRLGRSRDGLPLLAVDLGGETLRAVLDTGTTRSMIAAVAAERLGLVARARFEIATATGPARTAHCAGPIAAQVAGLAITIDCLGWVPGEARLAGATDADLLLGSDALGSLALWLALERGRARLARPGALAPWVRGERLALEPIERRPAVAVELEGLGEEPLRLVLDSGADAPLLFGDAARRLGGRPRAPARRGRLVTAAGEAVREALDLGSLRLGAARVVAGWGLLLPEVTTRQEDGLLPLALLGPVLLDVASGVVVVGARMRSRPEGGAAEGILAALDPAR